MKLENMKIGVRLRLGLGLILALVIGLGVLAWRQADLLWVQTKTIYEHPLQVRGAIDALKLDISAMRLEIRNLLLAENDQDRQTALQNSSVHEADAERQFKIIYERYLGPSTDIDEAHDSFVRWVSVESIQDLARIGKIPEVLSRLKDTGEAGRQRGQMFGQIKDIDDFARKKAGQLYEAAVAEKDVLNHQLTATLAAILLLSVTITYFLSRSIRDPLQKLTTAAEQFRHGKLEVRSGYVSANEFGALSTAFNAMAGRIEEQIRLNERTAQLAEVMLRETEARAFCRELLKTILEHTGSQIGAVYLLNSRNREFELFESIGLGAGGRSSFSAVAYEGEFGAALAAGRMQRITDIPSDTRFTLATVSGEFKPREIITLPLLAGPEAVAMVSLASVRGYDPLALRLLEGILSTLTARMNGVLAYQQIKELAERLEHQNRELAAQKQEMEAQAGEMAAQSQELRHQNAELETQKRQLDEASRLKSAFLSNMSHELRTPLNSVIALSGVLNRRLAKTIPAEEHSYLEVIERNGKLLLSLINDILDLSRIEAGKQEVNPTRFALKALVGEVVAMLEPQAREKGIALANLLDDDLPPIQSDPEKCRHILQNLAGNAVKFTESGSVEITARRVGEEVHLTVRDTGIGITPGQLPFIFDEFRQADDSASRKYGGTGLGLAIARKYALLLRGGITAESSPGQGSAFTLKLPLAFSQAGSGRDGAAATSYSTPASDGRGATVSGQGQCILLVDDSEPAIIQMTDILTGNGYQVQVARNGREALEQIEQAPPDAVILDLMMPEMDGFEVLKMIRSVEKAAGLPVLILTAKHVTREELSFLKGNHVQQLIQKGDVGKDELLAAVSSMVAPALKPTATPARPRTRKPRSGKPVILVVEDNADNLRTMRALLEYKCTVLEATDGRAGVEQARTWRPDLILMDAALPVMDGFAALAEIRETPDLSSIPVVAVTASAMKGDREEILARGFDGYLSKPVDHEALKTTMREWLDWQ